MSEIAPKIHQPAQELNPLFSPMGFGYSRPSSLGLGE